MITLDYINVRSMIRFFFPRSYQPTSEAVMCWLEDKNSFILDGDTEESSVCNETLIKMCEKVQKYETDIDSNEKYMQQLSSVVQGLETNDHPNEGNVLKTIKITENTESGVVAYCQKLHFCACRSKILKN